MDWAGQVGVGLAATADLALSVVVVVGDTGLLDVDSTVVALNGEADLVLVFEVKELGLQIRLFLFQFVDAVIECLDLLFVASD